ncbi:MAG: hypothetical protein JW776_16460 [Candidatus Lokiarchaeota archaeon]|nr:hypothetical protein [Candidatus Lokiarchaeota archaeon]
MARILLDLSHNERYTQIPSGIFDFDFTFEFLYPGMHFAHLNQYDLIIIGEILPAENEIDHLFLKTEIDMLEKYIREGGKLFLSTSSGGDFEYKKEDADIEDYGSIRALKHITGIKRYWWGELFHPSKALHYKSPENLVLSHFPSHPIFQGINQVMLADTTFLEPSKVHVPKALLTTSIGTKFRYYVDDSEERVDRVPIITTHQFGRGICLVIGSTLFMSRNEQFGSSVMDNSKLFFNIINWLCFNGPY